MKPPRFWRLGMPALVIVLISGLHLWVPESEVWIHPLLESAYYVPILLVAVWFGWRGGVAAAALSSLLYAPHLIGSWLSSSPYRQQQLIELPMFFLIATLTGVLADEDRRSRHRAEAAAARLAAANRELQTSLEQLQRADRLSALGELSAGLAHEIRNPLGSIDGAVQILQRHELAPEVREEFAAMAGREVGRLKSLLTSFLDFARPQPPSRTEIEPRTLLEGVAQLARQTAEIGAVQLLVEPLANDVIAVDAEQIKQVLLNLVLNAVQAMPGGGTVTLRSRRGANSLMLDVIDTGSGIPPDVLDRIFDPFFTTRTGGTGLGLAIAQRILGGHGGQIAVKNNADHGATFTLALPCGRRDDGSGTGIASS